MASSLDDLRKENEKLKNQLEEFKKRIESLQEQHTAIPLPEDQPEKVDDLLTIVVFGASGDLAKKKTYPAIYSLYLLNLLPKNLKIIGFARSPMPDDDFRSFIAKGLKDHEKKDSFLQLCSYFVGKYDADESYKSLHQKISKHEGKTGNRIFYMAIPPSIFYAVAKGIRHFSMSSNGWNRVIVEKPFGKDLLSFEELSKQMSGLFSEDELYRIDHYLGKEMVQNLMALRFANQVFEPLWNRFYIKNVQITFKEDIGTEGRGGYFDQFGIIRDVMQNHLLQIFSLVAMEPPFSLSAEDVRDEKVKLLRYVPPIRLEETVIGQYTASPDGSTPGYLEDKSVPEGSVCPTFATCILHVDNSRWSGVPFILKCGKGLNERKAEVRIQFTVPPNGLYKDAKPNELVLRVQPKEAVYLKLGVKEPGLSDQLTHKELDLSYHDRFQSLKLPDAYERLIYDVVRGDHNLFVRGDELSAAWKIFTPLLHKLENDKVKPLPYTFGSRGPAESDELIQRFGFQRNEDYTWPSKI